MSIVVQLITAIFGMKFWLKNLNEFIDLAPEITMNKVLFLSTVVLSLPTLISK
jgi:hypothetical protein